MHPPLPLPLPFCRLFHPYISSRYAINLRSTGASPVPLPSPELPLPPGPPRDAAADTERRKEPSDPAAAAAPVGAPTFPPTPAPAAAPAPPLSRSSRRFSSTSVCSSTPGHISHSLDTQVMPSSYFSCRTAWNVSSRNTCEGQGRAFGFTEVGVGVGVGGTAVDNATQEQWQGAGTW
jgi:hypothetical protein